MSPKAQKSDQTLEFETCPFCRSYSIMKLPIYDDGTMYRRHRWNQGAVSYAKTGVKTSEIIKCGNCNQVIAIDVYAGEKNFRGRQLNPNVKIRKKAIPNTSPDQVPQNHQKVGEQKEPKKPRCRHLKTSHADPNALFCHECGKLTIVGKFLQLDNNKRRIQMEW
ncbi:MAG: hypothetical protein ACFFC6_00515 [Promethearchaeota archaeon]